jgi:DNA repair exonuclease SbcCD ATPase subunit
MYIDRIHIQNIRGFTELVFDLKRPDGGYAGWTVFTGDNGSGKSTLLKAVAICLTGAETARALQPSFKGWVRDGADDESAAIELTLLGC